MVSFLLILTRLHTDFIDFVVVAGGIYVSCDFGLCVLFFTRFDFSQTTFKQQWQCPDFSCPMLCGILLRCLSLQAKQTSKKANKQHASQHHQPFRQVVQTTRQTNSKPHQIVPEQPKQNLFTHLIENHEQSQQQHKVFELNNLANPFDWVVLKHLKTTSKRTLTRHKSRRTAPLWSGLFKVSSKRRASVAPGPQRWLTNSGQCFLGQKQTDWL